MSEAVRATPSALIALRTAGEGLTALGGARIRASQTGAYRSPFKGRGVEFEESRQYQPGDDVRAIDWRVTARTGQPHTKVYREERERPVLFCVDFRYPMFFATRGVFKTVLASRIVALLAWCAGHGGDRVGGLLFSGHGHTELKPRRGVSAILSLIKALCEFGGRSFESEGEAGLESTASRLRRVARPGSLVFVVSDFRGFNDAAKSRFAMVARHCGLMFVMIYDPLEHDLPPPGRYALRQGDREVAIQTYSKRVREAYRARFRSRYEDVDSFCRRFGVGFLSVSTESDPVPVLRNCLANHKI